MKSGLRCYRRLSKERLLVASRPGRTAGPPSAPKFTRHEIAAGRDTGIGTQFLAADINGDGKIDIALSNKKGVNLLIQK